MSMVNGFRPEDRDRLSDAQRTLVARRERLLGPAYRLFYEHPLHPVRGEGVWLEDDAGERYLDAYNNVACVGHCHPAVVEVIGRQAARLATHTRYLDRTILDYAEALLATFSCGLDRVMFTCTGSEANDLATRIACHHTGGTGVVVTANAYHGVSAAVSAFSPSLGVPGGVAPHVRTVPWPGAQASQVGDTFAAHVRRALADLRDNGIRPAMLIVDTIFSSDGVYPGEPGFLAPAVAAIREAGGLFVADEVQAGFGRLGEAMWGFQRHGLVPDLVTLGKPMGNGYPVAGLVARAEVIERFGREMRYFNTFAGNPVAAAAGLAVLDVIRAEGLVANAQAVGRDLRDGLADLARRHPSLAAVRGAGLYVGVDVERDGKPDAALAAKIVNGLRERRVLISASGPRGNVLKIRPPLPFSRENAGLLLDTLDAVLRTGN